MKNISVLYLLLFFSQTLPTLAQEQHTASKETQVSKTWIKVNAPALLVGIPQVGGEYHFNPSWSYQIDVLGSFWKSFKGIPLEIGMLSQELRYYFDRKPSGWFAAVNLSGAKYRIQKWDYWGTDYVQQGQSIFIGATFGYAWYLSKNKNWKAEIFLGGGNQQAWYKGINRTTGEREDPISLGGWNKSGEFLPYRGGLMISFLLHKNNP